MKGQTTQQMTLHPTLGDLLADDPLAQWKAYYSLLVSAVPGLAGNAECAFQFVSPERTADWWEDPALAVDLIDTKPATGGAFYAAGSTAISDNYAQFLGALNAENDDNVKMAIEAYKQAVENDAFPMSMGGNLAEDFKNWKNGQGNPLYISIVKDTKTDNTWNLVAAGDIEVAGFIISGKGEALDTAFVNNKYKLTINYQAMKAYPMSRARSWWKGGVITAYQKQNQDLFKDPYTPNTFFQASKGLLNMIPTSAVVGFRSTIELTISLQNYVEHREDLEGHGQVSIGPFKLGANVRYSKTETNTTDESTTITYQSTNVNPILMGVFSEIHGLS